MGIARARRGVRREVGARRRTTALTCAQLRELEAELQRERARLERSLVGEAPHDWAGRGAATDGIGGRLARGDYGRCARCGARIPYGRLLVMPEAVHCIACAPGV